LILLSRVALRAQQFNQPTESTKGKPAKLKKRLSVVEFNRKTARLDNTRQHAELA